MTGRPYSDTDLELLSILTTYLAMAVENALLYRDIARSRAHNEEVLNHMGSGIVAIDSQGIVTLFNAAAGEILGVGRGDIMGQKVERMGSVFADLLHRTLRGEVAYVRHEVVSPVKKKPLGVSTYAMKDEEGRAIGAILVFADLSTIKKMEEKEKDFERIEFWAKVASRLAHEVKNPLVPIKTFAQLLPQRHKDKEFREEFFKVVNSEIERLNDIITQLTKFADSPPVQLRSTPIHRVIEDALNSEKAELTAKNARIVKNFTKEPIMARVDSALLSEAFANIIDNAAEAIPEKGIITISTALTQALHGNNGAVEILFQDNGEGIGKDELEDAFTPFAASQTRGVGLGLAIAKRIVMDHQGSIGVDSAPGKGSVVRVVIPIEVGSGK
jgi:PAS domain S-box-containing protein